MPEKKTATTKKKSTSRTKGSAEGAVRDALAPYGFPTAPGPGLCFRSADDELFARGFPDLRFVVKEPPPPSGPIKSVETALDAIDPALRLRVPREIARRYLLGYRVGPMLFVGDGAPRKNERLRKQRAEAVRSDDRIDVALLDDTLDRHCREMGDTYARWRTREVLYLFEGFLGAEVVARSVVRHLLRLAVERELWGAAGDDPSRANAAGHYLALALVPLLRRVPPEVGAELRKSLGAARHPDEVGDHEPRAYFALLRAIAERSAPPHPSAEGLRLDLALVEHDAGVVAELVDRVPHALMWNVARVCWLLGTERLAGQLDVAGHDLSRMVEQIGLIRDPGVVRLMARIATQRTGRADAAEWLRANDQYARPILDSLAKLDDAKEVKAAETALELIAAQSAPPPSRKLEVRELEAEIADIFAELGATLAQETGPDEQMAAIRDAHERYTEARAAAGHPVPEAYFTHRFGDFGLGKWAMLAVDAIR